MTLLSRVDPDPDLHHHLEATEILTTLLYLTDSPFFLDFFDRGGVPYLLQRTDILVCRMCALTLQVVIVTLLLYGVQIVRWYFSDMQIR